MIQKILGSFLIVIMIALVVMLLAQETFKDILIPMGLYHPERGVFTDCSLPENKHIKFCEPSQPAAVKDWRSVKDGAGFDISE